MVLDGDHLVTPSSSPARFRANLGESMSLGAVAQIGEQCRYTAKVLLSPARTEPSGQSAEYKYEERKEPNLGQLQLWFSADLTNPRRGMANGVFDVLLR